jgi:hypothetical protein
MDDFVFVSFEPSEPRAFCRLLLGSMLTAMVASKQGYGAPKATSDFIA